MNPSNVNPSQMQALLQYASARLGLSPEQLAQAVSEGGYEQLSRTLSPQNRQKLQALVGDPAKAQALLGSAQVKELLSRFHHTQND